MKPAIELSSVCFGYSADSPIFTDLSLTIPLHSKTLLLGANGSGKSTLLRIISGRHLLKNSKLSVLGGDPFVTPSSDRIHYVGGQFPLELDLAVSELLARYEDVPRDYQKELLELLGIHPGWRMHRVSSGQRRRVDLLLSLLRPPQVFLLDEVTSELDILMRQDLLAWLKAKCEASKMTVVFATHILDGLEKWADQLVFLSPVETSSSSFKVRYAGPLAPVLDGGSLLTLANRWLVEDRKIRKIYV